MDIYNIQVSSLNLPNQIINDVEVLNRIQKSFSILSVKKVELQKVKGNSLIYKLTLLDGSHCVLKMYPDRQIDKRPRLETEFSVCRILEKEGFPVMKAIAKDEQMNWGIYSWIEGHVIEFVVEDFIIQSINFIKRLKEAFPSSSCLKLFSDASEACFSGSEIVKQIQQRFDRLMAIDSEELHSFLLGDFFQVFNNIAKRAEDIASDLFNIVLSSSLSIASPSDFGSHNAIMNQVGETIFIDFEYFGWDDPVKLVSDYYWHPAMNLSTTHKKLWLSKSRDLFLNDEYFDKRLEAYLPLFGLRWCLIILNKFLHDRLAQCHYDDDTIKNDIKKIQEEQLQKSKNLLNEIIEMKISYGSAF